jgi:hydroxyacylglutathione hydrolase
VLGYLNGSYAAWEAEGKETDSIASISAFEFAHRHQQHPLTVIDVRKQSEYEAEHVVGATNIALDYINDNMASFPKDTPFYIHCAGGYRSVIASSILKARGYNKMVNVEGGFKAIAETEVPCTKTVLATQAK